ncbi:MAG: hypothetical protein ACE5FD_12350, partial [Anaerolineae bacterium]
GHGQETGPSSPRLLRRYQIVYAKQLTAAMRLGNAWLTNGGRHKKKWLPSFDGSHLNAGEMDDG